MRQSHGSGTVAFSGMSLAQPFTEITDTVLVFQYGDTKLFFKIAGLTRELFLNRTVAFICVKTPVFCRAKCAGKS